MHYYHFYVEQGLPPTQVLLWLSGEQLRAVFDHGVVAAYRCHDNWRTRKVEAIREGVFYPTRHVSSQGAFIPFILKSPWCSIARDLGGVTLVKLYPLNHYHCSSGSLRQKVSLASRIGHGNFGELCSPCPATAPVRQ